MKCIGLKENKTKFQEVLFTNCDTINMIKLPKFGGTVTIFCRNCGAEMHFVFDRAILDTELRYSRATDESRKHVVSD
jgi:hypothetical protein